VMASKGFKAEDILGALFHRRESTKTLLIII